MDRVLRPARIFAKWVLVALGVVAWLVVVPLLDVVRGTVERIRHSRRRQSAPGSDLDGDAT